MTQVVYLSPGEAMPDLSEPERWLTVEADSNGLFYGTGSSFKANGEWVGYISLAETDISLEAAVAAAADWAAKYQVPTIWVQSTPDQTAEDR